MSSRYCAGFCWRISEAAIAGNAAKACCCCCWVDLAANAAAAAWLATANGSILERKCFWNNSICSLVWRAANVDARVSAGDCVRLGIVGVWLWWLFDDPLLLLLLWWWWWWWEWWLWLFEVLLLWWCWWWLELFFVETGFVECLLDEWRCLLDGCACEDEDDCFIEFVVEGGFAAAAVVDVVLAVVVAMVEFVDDWCWNFASSSFSCCKALMNAWRRRFEWSCFKSFFCDVFVQRSQRIFSSILLFESFGDDISCQVTDQSVPHWAQTWGIVIEISDGGRRLTMSAYVLNACSSPRKARNSDQPFTPGIKVRSHVDGFGVGICRSVCSNCLRKANLALSKCCSAATPLPWKEISCPRIWAVSFYFLTRCSCSMESKRFSWPKLGRSTRGVSQRLAMPHCCYCGY